MHLLTVLPFSAALLAGLAAVLTRRLALAGIARPSFASWAEAFLAALLVGALGSLSVALASAVARSRPDLFPF